MISDELSGRLRVEPFEPFCIETVNSRRFNVFDPQSVSVLRGRVFIADTVAHGWCVIPFHAIALIEALIDDFASGMPADPDEEAA